MKRSIFSIIFIFTTFLGISSVITVDNGPNSGSQYTSMQTAHDNASSGDTLLVHGSSVNYGFWTMKKKLHIIGSGYKPNKQVPHSTKMSIQLEEDFANNPSFSVIEGLDCSIVIQSGFTNPIHDIVIRRCSINLATGYAAYNITGYNNIFTVLALYDNSGYVFYNNIILSLGTVGSNINTSILSNNLFLGALSINICENFIFSNNIFYFTSPNNSHAYCTFTNNLSYFTSNDTFNVTGTNSGGSNIIGQNPSFVDVQLIAAPTYLDTEDYHLSSSSVGKNAGSDSTDIGIYGGTAPFPEGGSSGGGYQTSQEPAWPQIYEMNIQNAVINKDDSLRIIIKARKED